MFYRNIFYSLTGGMAAGIYTTNNAEATWYVANHSDSAIAVAEDTLQVEKFVSTKARLPHLRYIVQYTGTVSPAHREAGVVSWKDFLLLGDTVDDTALIERKAYQKPGHCCMLIYTSGTTGNPKAVMLSHDNLTWTASAALNVLDLHSSDRIVSYLPLSHVAAQLIDIHLPMYCGASVSFARPDALKGTLVDTLVEVRPTIFFGVPRVWEKIEEKMKLIGASNGVVKQALGSWAKRVGLSGSMARITGDALPWGWTLAEKVVFNNIKKALGLDQCRLRATAAAPIARETLEYLMSLDLPLLEIYGMSESTGPHTINFPHRQRMFSVGMPFDGAYHKLEHPDKDGNGEICMWGRHVFMGYMKNEEETRKTISPEGFLHTGDLGKVDENGFLFITGRIKELIITAGGENVAPVLIEDNIKAELPLISNAMVIGDKRKFLSAILTLKSDMDAEGNPTDKLSESAVQWLNANGVQCTYGQASVRETLKNEQVLKLVQEGIDRANKLAISAAQRINKWSIIPTDFSLASGELTPTLKLKRRVVLDNYADLIASFYVEAKL